MQGLNSVLYIITHHRGVIVSEFALLLLLKQSLSSVQISFTGQFKFRLNIISTLSLNFLFQAVFTCVTQTFYFFLFL